MKKNEQRIQISIEQQVQELDALADLMIDKARAVKTICLRAKEKMAGVSTPALRKGLSVKQGMDLVAKRRMRINKSQRKKPGVGAPGN